MLPHLQQCFNCLDYRIITVADSVQQFLGWPALEVISKNFDEMVCISNTKGKIRNN